MQQMCVKVRCERSNGSRKGALQGVVVGVLTGSDRQEDL